MYDIKEIVRKPTWFISFAVFTLVSFYLYSVDAFILYASYYLLFLGAVFAFNRLKLFITDWLFFYMVLFISNILRGQTYQWIQYFHLPVYSNYIIQFENFFTPGTSLAQILQSLLTTTEQHFNFLQKLCTAVYASHFVYFLAIGLYLWQSAPKLFLRYQYSILFCAYGALVFYLLVPTTPPWLAAEQKLIPYVQNSCVDILNAQFAYLVATFNTHPVAAMPSLHATFPLVCFFYLKEKGAPWPSFIYWLLVVFSTILLGAHYIGDILAGMLLAYLSYVCFRGYKPEDSSSETPLNQNTKLTLEVIKTITLALSLQIYINFLTI